MSITALTSRRYSVVVLDIEGTTTPISFVHDVLFPYVSDNLEEFLASHWEEEECRQKVEALREQAQKDISSSTPSAVPILPASPSHDASDIRRSVVDNVRWQMSIDRKIGPLKSLQPACSMLNGYRISSEHPNSVYPDVTPSLSRWTETHSLPVYIYSSGSVEAQKLLFGYSDKGDLLKYFSGHFDTSIGLKIEPSSYTRIAQEIGKQPEEILFVSDNIKEIAAALQTGYQVAVADRPGNAPLPAPVVEGYVEVEGKKVPVVQTFEQIFERTVDFCPKQ
ncbi:Enolase-phosphatase E1 [Borealophlyctis nickersoniae]|nr:Enolase-phosphatase E1 [Borealophlyctis nickersoniae]